MAASPAPFLLPRSRIGGLGDSLIFRDHRGRGRNPSLVPGGEGLIVNGGFVLNQTYTIPKETGRKFVEITRDENPIHTEGDIVPGALTIAKIVLPLEVLFEGMSITKLRSKFSRPARYGARTVNHYFVNPGAEELLVRVATYQEGALAADTEVRAKRLTGPEAPARETPVEEEAVGRIREFLACLDVDSRIFFHHEDADRYTYPKAYLAALPSGELVRQFQGEGGLLNVLELEFEPGKFIPISEHPGPEVVVEERRLRRTFHQVMTRIWDGLVTFCRGSALLHPPMPAP